jgi:hypothetical protein
MYRHGPGTQGLLFILGVCRPSTTGHCHWVSSALGISFEVEWNADVDEALRSDGVVLLILQVSTHEE